MPTIFEVYDNKREMMQEEIFAPVVGVMKIKTAEEAINLTNDNRYGLLRPSGPTTTEKP